MEANWWETSRQLVEIHTLGWFMEDATGRNTKLRGWILSQDGRGIQLMQQRTGTDEENGSGHYKVRRIFIPWNSVVYISEPDWRERDEQLMVVRSASQQNSHAVDG